MSKGKLSWCCGTAVGAAWSSFSHCVLHVGAGHVLCWSPRPGEARTEARGVLALLLCPAGGALLYPHFCIFISPPLFKFISLRQPGLSLLENYSDKSSLSSNYLNGGKGGEIHLESTSLRD